MQRMQTDDVSSLVKVYAAPSGAVLQNNYKVRVRAVGENEWRDLPTYRVKVDMHDVRYAEMAYFDFSGKAEVEVSGPFYICEAVVRPLAAGIDIENDTKRVRFTLDRPVNISIELNKDRYHNVHLFAGMIDEHAPDNDEKEAFKYTKLEGDLSKPGFIGPDVFESPEFLNKRKLWITPGIYYVDECVMDIPGDSEIYVEGGGIIIGGFRCQNAENVKIWGRPVFYQAGFERFNGINGIRLSFSKNIVLENIIFVNPCHYTVYMGGCENVYINNVKSFSCEGWSDGIDMMSSRHIRIEGGFLRTSDDCIAIYGSRWKYYGDCYDIVVQNIVLWADVAHPTMIGTHGDHKGNGDRISGICFRNLNILEHNEPQAGYLGCMAINAGDKNIIEDVTYENINIEPFLHGKVIDLQVRWNKDYNPAPGGGIKNITFRNIYYHGDNEVTSVINGYDESRKVENITIVNFVRNGLRCRDFGGANIKVGRHTKNVVID
ncbi:MAG: hypothetical protein K5669_10995 [Lachnospiraceae bacterium]|nr:hypothetical protein [Lachnospiraceae bacterium]